MSLGYIPASDNEDDVEFFVLTPAEWEYRRQAMLARAGVTYEELEAQARTDQFDSWDLKDLWYAVKRI